MSKLKSQLEKQRALLREEHKMEIASLNDKVRESCMYNNYVMLACVCVCVCVCVLKVSVRGRREGKEVLE